MSSMPSRLVLPLGREISDVESWSCAENLRESAIRRAYADLSGELVGR